MFTVFEFIKTSSRLKIKKVLLKICIRFIKPSKTNSSSLDFGVCSLLCHKDVDMYICGISSFFYQIGKNYPLFICDDTTLTKFDKRKLQKYFTVIFSSEEKMSRAYNKVKYPNLWDYRFRPTSAKTKRKIDAILFNPFKRYIVLDADILFIKPPEICIKFIHNQIPQKIYFGGRDMEVLEKFPDVMGYEYPFRILLNAYFHRHMNITFNNAIFLVGSHRLFNFNKLDKVMNFFNTIKYVDYSMVDETVLFLLWSSRDAVQLPSDKYFMSATEEEFTARDKSRAEAIHYMGNMGLKEKFIFDAIKLMIQSNFFKKKRGTV